MARHPRRAALPLALLGLQWACGGAGLQNSTSGTGGTGGNGTPGGPTAFILPTATLTVDGNGADWAGISPLATSPQGNGSPNFPGSDVKALYVAKDATNLYLRLDLWDGINAAFWNGPAPNNGCYRFNFSSEKATALELGVAWGGYNTLPYPGQWSMGYNGSNSSNAPGALQGPAFVGVGANLIECVVPLADLGNPTAFYAFQGKVVSITGASGSPATTLDLAQVPQAQNVCVEGTVVDGNTHAPIQGAVVGTSLDGQTISTNASGYFFLQTATAPNYGSTAYAVTLTAPGYTASSQTKVWGNYPTAQAFSLLP